MPGYCPALSLSWKQKEAFFGFEDQLRFAKSTDSLFQIATKATTQKNKLLATDLDDEQREGVLKLSCWIANDLKSCFRKLSAQESDTGKAQTNDMFEKMLSTLRSRPEEMQNGVSGQAHKALSEVVALQA